MIYRIIFLLGISLLIMKSPISAQSSDTISVKKIVLIKKIDGGEYIGEIVLDDGREILLITKNIGKIYINKSDISSISKVDENVKSNKNGEFRTSGPFTTRYYFTNNALPIKKNENYALVHVYGPEVHFSVGNKTSLGIMASWIASPIGLVLKQQIYSKNKFHVSIGSILGSSGYINQGQTYGGLHWGTITIGDRTSNISFSAGLAHINWPSSNTDFMSNSREIGKRYSYSFNDQNHPYFIAEDDYNSQTAFEDSLGLYNWDGYSNSNSRNLYKDKQLATVIGVSGIAPIGKKASFIFDSMIFIANKSKVNYTTNEKEITYERYNNSTGNSQLTDFTAVYGEGVISPETYRNITFILMPAMRFNQSYEKAFQVALAGFINYDEINGLNSAPVPMISWLRKF